MVRRSLLNNQSQINARPLITVVGPTAVGKTNKAFALAKLNLESEQYSGVDLISADSRQVYQGLEILTGADVPPSFQLRQEATLPYPFYEAEAGQLRLHGISIISPTQVWSVAHFQTFAREVIRQSWQASRLPIVVGGTGLYHRWLWHEGVGFGVAPNQEVREKARLLTVAELQAWLAEVAPERWAEMNGSDRANPRRLVRAIEIAQSRATSFRNLLNQANQDSNVQENDFNSINWSKVNYQQYLVTLPLELIKQKILKRAQERFNNGAVDEVRWLLSLSLPQQAPASSTLGVPEISQYLLEKTDADTCQQLWALHEFQYAKRQLTWWRNKSLE